MDREPTRKESITTQARLEAQREADRKDRKNRVWPVAPRGRFMTCKSCHVQGIAGAYPFSTNPDSGLCDDCH